MQDPNPFEDPVVAREWIASIESEQSSSRDNEIYPHLLEWSKSFSSKTIVEIGAGQGVCSSKIALSSDGNYIGVEPSDALLDRAKELYPESNKTFVKGTAYDTKLEDGSADAVFGIGVWFHLEDLDAAHKEIARITKPGGKLLIVTSNPDTNQMWESWFIEPTRDGKRVDGKVATPCGILSRNILYLHSQEEIVQSLSKNSFSVENIKKLGFGRSGERELGIWMLVEATKK